MKYTKIAAVLCMTGAFVCSAGEVYSLSKVEDWEARSPWGQHAPNVLRAKGRVGVYSKKVFEYNPRKTYTFKGMYRQLPGSDSNIFRIGIVPLDKDKKVIAHVTSHPAPKTDTVLVKAVAAADTVMIIENGTKWEHRYPVAYNTKADHSDLPNKNIIRQCPKSVEKTGEGWKVTFAKPIGVAIPKGTGVRQQYDGGMFRFAGVGSGGEVLSDMKCTEWDIGTKYFQVFVMSGANGLKPGEQTPILEMKNPRLEVTE